MSRLPLPCAASERPRSAERRPGQAARCGRPHAAGSQTESPAAKQMPLEVGKFFFSDLCWLRLALVTVTWAPLCTVQYMGPRSLCSMLQPTTPECFGLTVGCLLKVSVSEQCTKGRKLVL